MTQQHYLNIEKITRLMQERGLTEAQLAEKMGVTQRRLHGYLSSRKYRKIPFKIYYGLVYILEASVSDIITESPPE